MSLKKLPLLMLMLMVLLVGACVPATDGNGTGVDPDVVAGEEPGERRTPSPTASPDESDGQDQLGAEAQAVIDALEASGLAPRYIGQEQHEPFETEGHLFRVNSETLYLFETVDGMEAPPVESIDVEWQGPVTVFAMPGLVAAYDGGNQRVLEILRAEMGVAYGGIEMESDEPEYDEPPAASLQVGDEIQEGGVGTYCWTTPLGGDESVGVCADHIGVPTPAEPLLVEPGAMATLLLPLEETPSEISVNIGAATDQRKLEGPGPELWWGYQDGDAFMPVDTTAPYTFALPEEPGLYMVSTFIIWPPHGDVTYGFLVEVEGEIGELPGDGDVDSPFPEIGTPPPVTMRVAGLTQTGGLGSYCWTPPESEVPGLCRDTMGIPTPGQPITVSGDLTFAFQIPGPVAPDELQLGVMAVEMDNAPMPEDDGLRYWQPGEFENHEMPAGHETHIEMQLEPGSYLLSLFVRWPEIGDGSYGFLVTVE